MSRGVGVLKHVFFKQDKRELGRCGQELTKSMLGQQPALLTDQPYLRVQGQIATGAGVTEVVQNSIKPRRG